MARRGQRDPRAAAAALDQHVTSSRRGLPQAGGGGGITRRSGTPSTRARVAMRSPAAAAGCRRDPAITGRRAAARSAGRARLAAAALAPACVLG